MPRGSRPGERRGGRQKGTPNKRGPKIVELLQERKPDYDAVVLLAHISEGKQYCDHDDWPECGCPPPTMDQRIQCLKEVAQYQHGKRKAVDDTGDSADRVIHEWPFVDGDEGLV